MRYFFNLVSPNGSLPDQEGIEVTNIDELRAKVAETIEEVRRADALTAADWKAWRLEVADQSGVVILMVDLDRASGRSV
jgi:hypothetical protein